jgi:hypothetical protein
MNQSAFTKYPIMTPGLTQACLFQKEAKVCIWFNLNEASNYCIYYMLKFKQHLSLENAVLFVLVVIRDLNSFTIAVSVIVLLRWTTAENITIVICRCSIASRLSFRNPIPHHLSCRLYGTIFRQAYNLSSTWALSQSANSTWILT